MEKFRLRVQHQPKKGNIWELHLLPDAPGAAPAAARLLGSVSTQASINWLREICRPYFERPEIRRDVERFGARTEPVFLKPEDGMRLALAFTAARYLPKPRQRRQFREGLAELPSEVVLYWFTLCYYGNRTAAGRAALRTLLAYQEPPPPRRARSAVRKAQSGPDLFSLLPKA